MDGVTEWSVRASASAWMSLVRSSTTRQATPPAADQSGVTGLARRAFGGGRQDFATRGMAPTGRPARPAAPDRRFQAIGAPNQRPHPRDDRTEDEREVDADAPRAQLVVQGERHDDVEHHGTTPPRRAVVVSAASSGTVRLPRRSLSRSSDNPRASSVCSIVWLAETISPARRARIGVLASRLAGQAGEGRARAGSDRDAVVSCTATQDHRWGNPWRSFEPEGEGSIPRRRQLLRERLP